MAWVKIKKGSFDRASECRVSISKGGILSVGKGAMRQFGFTGGKIEMIADDENPDRIGFRFVEEADDEADTVSFRELKKDDGQITGYSASIGSFLSELDKFKVEETMSFPLLKDETEGVFYFLRSRGLANSRKKVPAPDAESKEGEEVDIVSVEAGEQLQ